MVLLKLIFVTVLLTLMVVAALSFRLFRKDGKLYQSSCQPKLASESNGDGGCGCGGCGCGGGGGNK